MYGCRIYTLSEDPYKNWYITWVWLEEWTDRDLGVIYRKGVERIYASGPGWPCWLFPLPPAVFSRGGEKCDLFGCWTVGLVRACLGLSLGLIWPKLLSLGCFFISSVIGVHSGGDFCISEFESIYFLLKDSSSWCLVSISKF